MKKNESLISIIVPVYNASKYLRRCVESILSQTYSAFELLLIDDGSNDSSGAICDEYANYDSRVRVFHKDNGGVSSARNIGIQNSQGVFIAFIDCDDEVESDYLEVLHDQIKISNSQLVCSYAKVFHEGKCLSEEHPEGILESDIIARYLTDYELRTTSAPWGKIFIRSIITENSITFDESMSIGEDTLFLFDYLSCCNKMSIVNKTSYHYYINEQSLVRRINSIESELYSYNRINLICSSILTNSTDDNIKLISEIGKMRAAYIRRVLNSLYYNPTTAEFRRNVIRSIDIGAYCNYHKSNSVMEKTYLWLLQHRMIACYDGLRYIVYSTKRLLNN